MSKKTGNKDEFGNQTKQTKTIVRARFAFTDALTGKSFKAGDVVDGWDEERIAEYEKRNVVVSREIEPSELKDA